MLKIIEHPLLQQKLAKLRDENTDSTLFRRLIGEMTELLTVEATRHLETVEITVRTPLGETHGIRLARRVVCVPILRAGCGMEAGFRRVVPQASTGLIGLKRNETTLRPDQYYLNLPPHIEDADVFVVDPMLATGGSLVRALEVLRENGVTRLTVLTLVSAPEGRQLLEQSFPEVPVFTAALDERLNEHGYIYPGLGDAGDRIFGTIE